MSLINFTAEYDVLASQTDLADEGIDSDLVALSGVVVFTPQTSDDKPVMSSGFSPRPAGIKLLPIVGYVDTDGRLKSAPGGAVGVRLIANDPVLGLERLVYRVDSNLRTPAGQRVKIATGYLEAPATDITVNLADALESTGYSSVSTPPTFYSLGDVASPIGEQLVTADTQTSARAAIDAASTSEVAQQLVDADIPGQITTAIASDETVIGAAESAVDAAVVAADLVSGTTTADDTDAHFGLQDNFGRRQLTANTDGTVDIPLPVLAGVKLREVGSPDGYLLGAVDSQGRLAENVIDSTGQVPRWVLERWQNRMGWGQAAVNRDWLVITAGQSNMKGYEPTAPSGLYVEDSRLLVYDATQPFDKLTPIPATEGSLWAQIGRQVLACAPENVRVVVINSAVWGTGFRTDSAAGTWDRTDTSNPINLYNNMLDDVEAVQELLPDITVHSFHWSQGEADVTVFNQSTYAAKLDDMIGAIRTAVGVSTLPVVIASMVPEWVAESTATREPIQFALTDTPRRVLHTAYVDGPKGMALNEAGDTRHFLTAGMGDRARSMVRGVERARWNYTNARPVPPPNLRVWRSGTTLYAEWEPPITRHTAITVEFSVNAGSTWTAMTKPAGDIGLSATATISASDVVQVRARTTNEYGNSTYLTTQT